MTAVERSRARIRGRIRPGVVPAACLAVGVVAAAASWGVSWATRAGARPGRAVFAPCVVWAVREVGRCGTVPVLEDRDGGNRDRRPGRPIPLRVVVLRARGPGPTGEPVVLLAGGPGMGAASDGVAYAADVLAGLRARHDIILADQRGTGRSNALTCDLTGNALQPHVAPSFPVEGVRRCREVVARHADLTQYTTARSADDLADVLDALGVRRASVFGISYGGRLALAFLRRHGERVRTAVVQGAPPPERVVPLAAAAAGARALAARAGECLADSACTAEAPDPAGDVRAVLDRLAARPVRVTRWNWRRLRREEVVVTRRAFAEDSWAMLYDAGKARALFGPVHRAVLGDWTPWLDAAVSRGRWREYRRSRGLTLSVLCTEDAPRIARADTARLAAASPLGLPIAAELVAACAEWPKGRLAPEDTLPVRSDVPVLFLSGALDPVAPPEWADSARAFLPASWHLVAPGAGHGAMNDCTRTVIARFVEQGGAVTLRTPCVASWSTGALLANPDARR